MELLQTVVGLGKADSVNYPNFIYWIIFTTAIFSAWYLFFQGVKNKNAPKWWGGGHKPILGAVQFYSSPRDFFAAALAHSKSGAFSFFIGSKHVIGLSGPLGRKVFYESRQLSLAEGTRGLLSSHPVTIEPMDEFIQWFKQTFPKVFSKRQLAQQVLLVSSDMENGVNDLLDSPTCTRDSTWRVLDPFDKVYLLAYLLTMRIVGPSEISNDKGLLRKTLHALETIEHAKSVWKVALPWLPTLNFVRSTYNSMRLGWIIFKIATKRAACQRKDADAMQSLINMGVGLRKTTTFVMACIFVGQLNTAKNVAWIPVRLAQNPDWMRRVQEEVDAVIARHRVQPKQSAMDILRLLSLNQWESEFPIIGDCLRESIRFTLTGCALRKNISDDQIRIGDSNEVIPPNAYVAHSNDSIHMNPEVYKDPSTFNPGRHVNRFIDSESVPHSYVGWGSGVHPCVGQRIAKLVTTITSVYLIAMFEFQLSNEKGSPVMETKVVIDRNTEHAEKPSSTIFLRYRPRAI